MSDLAKNHDAIWLEPACKTYERSWCNHDEGPCEDCGLSWIKYVRADLRAPSPMVTEEEIRQAIHSAYAEFMRTGAHRASHERWGDMARAVLALIQSKTKERT